MSEGTIRVTVTRQEPGQPPRDETYDVPFDERTSVLDALDWIKDTVDATLTFRWSCRSAVCGSCGVMVNGRPVLGCETFVAGYATSGITVGPMSHAAVQRDLAVDTEDFLAKLRSAFPWMLPEPAALAVEGSAGDGGAVDLAALVSTQTLEQLEAFRTLAQCIDCMLCYAACPVLAEVPGFTGPAAIATAQRWNHDSRDGGDEQRFEALADNEEGIWPCIQNGACTRVCPKGVDPAKAIKDLQRLAMGA
ncbi:MAG: 4Fe-4S dicluster domain-containing protein [Cellulomonadaceae bacterium]|jgi:fumarate reductase iron-sulfur subunit|nr:4Fe-4S dicluster domain-containing protein [Cellulomonadaceae bacterium]